MELTVARHTDLILDYATAILDNMDQDDLYQIAFDSVIDRLKELSTEEFLNKVQEVYPALLEDDFSEEDLTSEE